MDPCSIKRSDSSQKRLWSFNSPLMSGKQPYMNNYTKNGHFVTISGGSSWGIHIDQKWAYISKLSGFFSKIFWKSIENILNTNPWKFGALTRRSYKVPAPNLMWLVWALSAICRRPRYFSQRVAFGKLGIALIAQTLPCNFYFLFLQSGYQQRHTKYVCPVPAFPYKSTRCHTSNQVCM